MNPKEHIQHVSSRTFYGDFLRTQSISLWTLWFIFFPYFSWNFWQYHYQDSTLPRIFSFLYFTIVTNSSREGLRYFRGSHSVGVSLNIFRMVTIMASLPSLSIVILQKAEPAMNQEKSIWQPQYPSDSPPWTTRCPIADISDLSWITPCSLSINKSTTRFSPWRWSVIIPSSTFPADSPVGKIFL